jgi:electron transfer flavoprotein alpha subunit
MATNPVVVCTWKEGRDEVPGTTEEVLTLGRRLGATLGSELRWLVLGPLPGGTMEIAARHGVAGVDHIDDPKLHTLQPDVYVETLAQYGGQISPRVVLFSQTFDVRLVAPRLAGRLGAGVVMNAVAIEPGEGGAGLRVTASAFGGDTRVVYELAPGAPTYVVSVNANAVLPESADMSTDPPVREIGVDLAAVEERIRVISRARAEGPKLEDAQVIVAGGRGLGEPENFKLVEDLADALGGMAAASRPIVDDGWADPSRQIGLTGKIARPALYVAAGISGASQHMVGCSAAKTIVAINNDPDAAIFRHARYGIVGNCLEILPELIRAAKAR